MRCGCGSGAAISRSAGSMNRAYSTTAPSPIRPSTCGRICGSTSHTGSMSHAQAHGGPVRRQPLEGGSVSARCSTRRRCPVRWARTSAWRGAASACQPRQHGRLRSQSRRPWLRLRRCATARQLWRALPARCTADRAAALRCSWGAVDARLIAPSGAPHTGLRPINRS